jgi:hypothetical protein
VEGFRGMKELRRGSCRQQGCGDLAGDQAALANAGEDNAMSALGGRNEKGCDLLKDLRLRTFEALGELLERLCLHADEVCGTVHGGRLGRLGHCGWRDIG